MLGVQYWESLVPWQAELGVTGVLHGSLKLCNVCEEEQSLTGGYWEYWDWRWRAAGSYWSHAEGLLGVLPPPGATNG